MGPQAGAALFDSITRHTAAAKDQDHLPVILMSFPANIVDRSAFLLGETPLNPAYSIAGLIRKLEHAGAGIIGMACNTAHAPGILNVIMEELDRLNSRVKLVQMPRETCLYIKQHHSRVRRVGVMTSNGTYRTGLYKDLLQELGFEVVLPDVRMQDEIVHRMIYDPHFGIKATPGSISDEVLALLDKILRFFEDKQADAIVLGCTELSLVMTKRRISNTLIIDATEILARALIREASAPHTFTQTSSRLQLPPLV
jgi:aspartate racemase